MNMDTGMGMGMGPRPPKRWPTSPWKHQVKTRRALATVTGRVEHTPTDSLTRSDRQPMLEADSLSWPARLLASQTKTDQKV